MHFPILLISLCLAFTVSVAKDDDYDVLRAGWAKFQSAHQRRYRSLLENTQRFAIYAQNMRHILQHNREFRLGKHSFDMDINQFGDRTPQEIAQQMTGFNQTLEQELAMMATTDEWTTNTTEQFAARSVNARNAQLPAEVDWTKRGAVTAVVSQGSCGSCWAFATAATFESHYFIKNGRLPTLSQQQLVDCSRGRGNDGCGGGVMSYAMDYVRTVGGMASSAAYPYRGVQQQCSLRQNDVIRMQGGAVRVTFDKGDEHKLMETIANVGPVAIAMDSSHWSFNFYKGGIYYEPQCQPGYVNHGVVVVGYGRDARTGADYWLVKNSWGRGWGENGFIRVARNRDNNCCVSCWGSYPLV